MSIKNSVNYIKLLEATCCYFSLSVITYNTSLMNAYIEDFKIV